MSRAPVHSIVCGDVITYFQPGLYAHYRGGLYTAVGLVRHHASGLPMVRYVSHEHATENVRPLFGWEGDADGFLDRVEHEGKLVERFKFIRVPDP